MIMGWGGGWCLLRTGGTQPFPKNATMSLYLLYVKYHASRVTFGTAAGQEVPQAHADFWMRMWSDNDVFPRINLELKSAGLVYIKAETSVHLRETLEKHITSLKLYETTHRSCCHQMTIEINYKRRLSYIIRAAV